MVLPLTRRQFTVDEYYRMARAGILTEDDRVELIEGEIVEMTPIGPRHAWRVDRVHRLFVLRFDDAALVRGQNPIRLSRHSEPEPDVALVRHRPDGYASSHPTPEDVYLIVEVAETSSRYDRRVKVPLYARHAIPETWLVDLAKSTLTIYRDPSPDGYRAIQTLRRGDRVSLLAFPDREIEVDDILGR